MTSNCHDANSLCPDVGATRHHGGGPLWGAAGPIDAIREHATSVARNLGEPWLRECQGHRGHTDEMATAMYRLRLDAATVSDQARVVDSTLLELTLTTRL